MEFKCRLTTYLKGATISGADIAPRCKTFKLVRGLAAEDTNILRLLNPVFDGEGGALTLFK